MSVKILSMVWEGYPGGGSELLALLALADWSDDQGRCYPSMSAIADKTRLSRSQAQRVVHNLIGAGFVSVEGNENGGRPGSTRRYLINLQHMKADRGRTGATGSAYATGRTDAAEGPHGCEERGRTHATQTVSEPSKNRQKGAKPHAAREAATADAGKKTSAAKGARLPAGWALPKAWGEWALAEVPGWSADHVRKVGETFGDYWRAKAGREATKADWLATWRNWVRREAERSTPPARVVPTGAPDPFRGAL